MGQKNQKLYAAKHDFYINPVFACKIFNMKQRGVSSIINIFFDVEDVYYLQTVNFAKIM